LKAKSFIICLCFMFCLLIIPCPSLASDSEALISDQFDQLNLEDLDAFLKKIDQDIDDKISGFSLIKIFEDARQGKLEMDISGIFKALISYFCREFLTHTSLLGKLIVLGALLAILEHLQSAFEQNTVAKLAHSIGIIALLTVALSSFTIAIQTGRDAIGNMVGFMQSLIPILLTLMAALGSLTTVALMHPVIYVSLNIIATLIQNIVFPLIFCAAILGIVSSLSERFQVSRLADLFRDGSMLLTGLLLTVFTGILGVQGVAGAVTDGVGLRTVKYLTGAVVPVVGGVLTDAVDAVAGCSLFIKNAVGIVGVLAILFLCTLPVVKILSAAVMYRLAAALLQPLGAQELSESLHLLGNYLLLVFAAVAAVGLMFFIALTIIVGLSNVVVMLR
jgi:stage III sporulation protein AE